MYHICITSTSKEVASTDRALIVEEKTDVAIWSDEEPPGARSCHSVPLIQHRPNGVVTYRAGGASSVPGYVPEIAATKRQKGTCHSRAMKALRRCPRWHGRHDSGAGAMGGSGALHRLQQQVSLAASGGAVVPFTVSRGSPERVCVAQWWISACRMRRLYASVVAAALLVSSRSGHATTLRGRSQCAAAFGSPRACPQ